MGFDGQADHKAKDTSRSPIDKNILIYDLPRDEGILLLHLLIKYFSFGSLRRSGTKK